MKDEGSREKEREEMNREEDDETGCADNESLERDERGKECVEQGSEELGDCG